LRAGDVTGDTGFRVNSSSCNSESLTREEDMAKVIDTYKYTWKAEQV
jgi:hypothetical protein